MLSWRFERKVRPRLPESRQCPAQNAQFRSIESTALPATETRQNGGYSRPAPALAFPSLLPQGGGSGRMSCSALWHQATAAREESDVFRAGAPLEARECGLLVSGRS
jgi:hypothetical protein